MDKSKTGIKLGILSIFPVIASIITILLLRGPDANIYLIILIIGVLSLVGITLAVVAYLKTKRILIGLFGFIGNAGVLFFTYLLLLAMGISEP